MPAKTIDKLRTTHLALIQMSLVFLAFGLMVFFSCVYFRGEKRGQLRNDSYNALTIAQQQIEMEMKELEMVMNALSQSVRYSILNGESAENVKNYILKVPEYVFMRSDMSGFHSAYGFFDVFGGMYVSSGNLYIPSDFKPQERPWYIAAVEAGGRTVMSKPFVSVRTGDLVMAYSRQILDDNGKQQGVIGFNVALDNINDIAIGTGLAGGYGFLVDDTRRIIAHPSKEWLGVLIDTADSGAEVKREMEQKKDFFEYEIMNVNYKEEPSVLSFKRLSNGWYLGTITPSTKYYAGMWGIIRVLVFMGGTLAVLLSAVLLSVTAAKGRAEKRISEEREKSEALARLQAETEAVSNAKSAFLATMSHEIRTPMSAILGAAEIQLQKDNLLPDIEEALNKIYDSGSLLLNIINDMLDISKIEAGKLELMPVRYDIPNLLSDTVQLNFMRLESRPVEFTLSLDENTPLNLYGDEFRVKQALNNLLSNAFKNTDKGKVELSVSAEFGGEAGALFCRPPSDSGSKTSSDSGEARTGCVLVLRVSDMGQGMTAEQRARLFDDFEHFSLAKNRAAAGKGLGMAITKRLVDAMNGEIAVESEPGRGSVFTVRLPLECVGSDVCGAELAEKLRNSCLQRAPKARKAQFIREYMPYGSVLVVDDVDSNLYVAKGFLQPYGLKIDTAASGIAAVEKIRKGEAYDVVFMDHMMPDMDGMEAVKIIRGMGYANPIVALTANAVVGQAEKFMANGFDGFLSKPIDVRELNASLNHFVRDRQRPETVEAARIESLRREAESGNRGLTDKSLAMIVARDAEKAVAELERILFKIEASGETDIKKYVVTVHGMKSALNNIGEKGLSAAALRLELAGRGGEAAVIAAETPVFLKNLRALIAKIKSEDGKNADHANPETGAYGRGGDQNGIGTAERGSKASGITLGRLAAPEARILVVDDISSNLKVVSGLLAPYKVQVDLCNSGAKAIEYVKACVYDIVLMDYLMPEMDGMEATAQIRALGEKNPYYKSLPVIALTADTTAGMEEMLLANGFNDFISKPVDISKLNAALERWIPRDKQEHVRDDAAALKSKD